MFDLDTNPWIIYVNSREEFDAAEKWLEVNFGKNLNLPYRDYIAGLTNVDCEGDFYNKVLYLSKGSSESCKRFEIKLQYHTFVEVVGVEYEEVKSESEKQLDAVMHKLAELQKEAEQLQETIKKEKK